MQIQTTLVIILAIGYGVLLLLAIVFMSLLIATVLRFRRLAKRLEVVANDPGKVIREFAIGIVPALFSGLMFGAKKTWSDRKKTSKGDRK